MDGYRVPALHGRKRQQGAGPEGAYLPGGNTKMPNVCEREVRGNDIFYNNKSDCSHGSVSRAVGVVEHGLRALFFCRGVTCRNELVNIIQ